MPLDGNSLSGASYRFDLRRPNSRSQSLVPCTLLLMYSDQLTTLCIALSYRLRQLALMLIAMAARMAVDTGTSARRSTVWSQTSAAIIVLASAWWYHGHINPYEFAFQNLVEHWLFACDILIIVLAAIYTAFLLMLQNGSFVQRLVEGLMLALLITSMVLTALYLVWSYHRRDQVEQTQAERDQLHQEWVEAGGGLIERLRGMSMGRRPSTVDRVAMSDRPSAASRVSMASCFPLASRVSEAQAGRVSTAGRPSAAGRTSIIGRPSVAGRVSVAGRPSVAQRPSVARRSSAAGRVSVADRSSIRTRAGSGLCTGYI